jgi:hypothetical protein
MVIDDDVHAEPSGEIGVVVGDLGGQRGITAGLFDRVSQ